jgi:O-antigen/teichoic acid export membrane protein
VRRAYLRVTQLTAMVAAPAMAVMAITAPHLVSTLYGPQWTGTVLPLQILCGAGYFRALYHLSGVVAHSAGRVYVEALCQVMYATLVIVGAMIGSQYGLASVATAVAVAIVCMFVATGHLALRITGTTWCCYLQVQLYAMLVTIITAAIALAILRLLEAFDATSAVIAVTMIAGSALTWGVGFAWKLGEPDFSWARERLPSGWLHLVERVGQLRPFTE